MLKKILLVTVGLGSMMASMERHQVMAQEQANGNDIPTLVVTNKPISTFTPEAVAPQVPSTRTTVQTKSSVVAPSSVGDIYTKPVKTNDVSVTDVMGADYYAPVSTVTSKKVMDIQKDMYGLQSDVAGVAGELKTLETVGQDLAANYYAAVATINTQLQSGTTPGNPRLKGRLVQAEDALETLSGNVADLNKVAVKIADLATVSNYLQQQARSAYGLSGSVEEDHIHLAQLEDELTNTSVAIERLLNSVNDNITRAAAYMSSERANLRTLALAITNGDLYGKSLSSRPFSNASYTDIESKTAMPLAGMGTQEPMTAVSQPRPLMKIRFDKPDVDYTQALYMSVSEAVKAYPQSQFELVAVTPGKGNPAKLAIESTKARRNAEKVLRNMVQMGVDSNKVDLANLTDDNLQYNEVHLYIR